MREEALRIVGEEIPRIFAVNFHWRAICDDPNIRMWYMGDSQKLIPIAMDENLVAKKDVYRK